MVVREGRSGACANVESQSRCCRCGPKERKARGGACVVQRAWKECCYFLWCARAEGSRLTALAVAGEDPPGLR